MSENTDTNSSPSQSDSSCSVQEYLRRAASACSQGNAVLGMHLYLTAFEQASRSERGTETDADAVEGLKRAWSLACELKERSLAEYIFEKLEPFLSSDEVEASAEQLQRLALDKLEEFGLSRSDLKEMTDAISQEFSGVGGVMMKFAKPSGSQRQRADVTTTTLPAESAPNLALAFERVDYSQTVGYSEVIKTMRHLGIGAEKDPEYLEFVKLLNSRHGLSRPPAADTLLFRCPAREDANRFMTATMGELGLPGLRMCMEENVAGMPMLCVMSSSDNQPKLNSANTAFEGKGVLLIEDIDLWGAPFADAEDSLTGFMLAQLSRGARDAISLIRSAVENPDVHVLVSCATGGEIDPFFCDLLEPFTIVDIEYPTPAERLEIWMDIAHAHPSIRSIDRAALVRYSDGLPRFDIYMAAREAVEEAYRASLMTRSYVPVTADNLFEKLAAYQPLESKEYRALEEAVIRDFSRGLDDDLNDFLRGAGE